VSRTADRRGVYRIWWETRGKETTRKIRSRGEDNIKLNLQEVGCGFMDWIDLPQDRDRLRPVVNAVMNF